MTGAPFKRALNSAEVSAAIAEWLHRRGQRVTGLPASIPYQIMLDQRRDDPDKLTIIVEVETVTPAPHVTYDITPVKR